MILACFCNFSWIDEKLYWLWEPDLATVMQLFRELLKNLIGFESLAWLVLKAWFGLWNIFSWITKKTWLVLSDWFKHLAIFRKLLINWLVLRAWFWPGAISWISLCITVKRNWLQEPDLGQCCNISIHCWKSWLLKAEIWNVEKTYWFWESVTDFGLL